MKTTLKSHFPDFYQWFLGTWIHWRPKDRMGAHILTASAPTVLWDKGVDSVSDAEVKSGKETLAKPAAC